MVGCAAVCAGLCFGATTGVGARHPAPSLVVGRSHVGFVGGLDDSARGVRLGSLAARGSLGLWFAFVGLGLAGLGAGAL